MIDYYQKFPIVLESYNDG